MGSLEEEVMAKIATVRQTKNTATRPATPAKKVLDATAEIEQLAYQFFVDRGSQHGFDQEDWTRAEAIVKNRKRA